MKETRWNSIASSIKLAIRKGDLLPGARIATEVEMAGQWNVSTMTVHRALSELQREGWVVRRRRAGTVIADRSVQPLTKIGLVFTGLSHLPQRGYLNGIEEAFDNGYKLVVLNSDNKGPAEAACLEKVFEECSAIVCYPTGALENTPLLKKIAASIPLVFVDSIPEGIAADVVMTDNYGSMLSGLNHLKSQGHNRVAYFMEDQTNVSSVNERYSAYLKFISQVQPDQNPQQWIRVFSGLMPRSQYYDRVESAIAELLSEPEDSRITAIACQQEAVMITVLNASVRLGISIPGELEVLTFDDAPPNMQPLSHYLHRLVQHPVEMGRMAAKRVQLRLITPDMMPQTMRLTTDLFPASVHELSPVATAFLASRHSK